MYLKILWLVLKHIKLSVPHKMRRSRELRHPPPGIPPDITIIIIRIQNGVYRIPRPTDIRKAIGIRMIVSMEDLQSKFGVKRKKGHSHIFQAFHHLTILPDGYSLPLNSRLILQRKATNYRFEFKCFSRYKKIPLIIANWQSLDVAVEQPMR